MKTFEARATELPNEKEKHTFATLALLCTGNTSSEGMRFDAMETRLSLRAKLKDKAVDTVIGLTEEEHADLAECVKAMRWGVISEDIVAFSKHVLEPKEFDTDKFGDT